VIGIGVTPVNISSANTNISITAFGIPPIPSTVPLVSISLSHTSLALGVGGARTLTAYYNPTDTTETGISWSSLNTGIATVNSESGLVTAGSPGTATIRATSTVNPLIYADCAVTVISGSGISVEFEGFGNEDIDLTKSTQNDLSKQNNSSLNINLAGDWDYVQWYRDGIPYGGGSQINVYANESFWTLGTHYVTAAVSKDGVWYSKEVSFKIVE
jgi:hypothetical protein